MPALASALNERSLTPPMSVTTPALIGFSLLSGLVAATAVATTVVVVVAARRDPEHERRYERQQDRAKLPIHAESSLLNLGRA